MLHETHEKTCEKLREEFAKSERAFQIAWRKAGNEEFAKHRYVSADEISRMIAYYGTPKAKRVSRKETNHSPTPPAPTSSGNMGAEAGGQNWTRTQWGWLAVMIVPVAASIQSMRMVIGNMADDQVSAVAFVAAFALAPFAFLLLGASGWFARIIIFALAVFEAFCNTTRVYGWLSGFEQGGNPTRFLGLVCDIFNSGTHYTALVLAAIMAALASGIFFAAFFQFSHLKSK